MAATNRKAAAPKAAAKPKSPVEEMRDASAAFVDVEMVRRALKFAGKGDIRYYLNGVCIKPSDSGGVLVIATDGHVALVLHDAYGKTDKTYILPFTKGRNEKGLNERGATHVVVSPQGGVTVVDVAMQPLFICPEALIKGGFPDVTGLVGPLEEYEPVLRGGFNPEYLRRALDSAPKNGRYQGVHFYSKKTGGESAATLFTTQHGFGLVVPLRDEAALKTKITKDFGGIK